MRSRSMIAKGFAFLLVAATGIASDFSFTGTFSQDDNLAMFQFTAPSSLVTLRTWSYAGGTNAAGQGISAGGFDPVLSLFDATGGLSPSSPLSANNDDGAGVATDPATGNALDSLLLLSTLNPGDTYVLVLSEYDNIANGPDFGSGFSQTGNGNFTGGEFGCGTGVAFCDSTPVQRTGSWAVDITGVGSAAVLGETAVPEPRMIWVLCAGIACLTLIRRWRRTRLQ